MQLSPDVRFCGGLLGSCKEAVAALACSGRYANYAGRQALSAVKLRRRAVCGSFPTLRRKVVAPYSEQKSTSSKQRAEFYAM
jgi:hypothetical protein